jgi:hypothetical protein
MSSHLCEARHDTEALDLLDQALQQPHATNQYTPERHHEDDNNVNILDAGRPVGNTRSYAFAGSATGVLICMR